MSTNATAKDVFIGRTEELSNFNNRVSVLTSKSAANFDSEVISLTGMGGVGKTVLLQKMVNDIGTQKKCPFILMDFNNNLPTSKTEFIIKLANGVNNVFGRRYKFTTLRAALAKLSQDDGNDYKLEIDTEKDGDGVLEKYISSNTVRKFIDLMSTFIPMGEQMLKIADVADAAVSELSDLKHRTDNAEQLNDINNMTGTSVFESLHKVFINDMVDAQSRTKSKLIIFIDAFDKFEQYKDDWVGEIVSGIPGIIWVFTSRSNVTWKCWANTNQIHPHTVKEFTKDEAADYIRKRVSEDGETLQEKAFEMTKGLPSMLGIFIDTYNTLSEEDRNNADKVFSRDILDSFLNLLDTPDRNFILLLGILENWTDKKLNYIMSNMTEVEVLPDTYEYFKQYAFVETDGTSHFRIHDEVRESLYSKASTTLIKEVSKQAYYYEKNATVQDSANMLMYIKQWGSSVEISEHEFQENFYEMLKTISSTISPISSGTKTVSQAEIWIEDLKSWIEDIDTNGISAVTPEFKYYYSLTLYNLCRFQNALTIATNLIEEQKRFSGPHGENTLRAVELCGDILTSLCRYDDAVKKYEYIADYNHEISAKDSVDTLRVRNKLVSAYIHTYTQNSDYVFNLANEQYIRCDKFNYTVHSDQESNTGTSDGSNVKEKEYIALINTATRNLQLVTHKFYTSKTYTEDLHLDIGAEGVKSHDIDNFVTFLCNEYISGDRNKVYDKLNALYSNYKDILGDEHPYVLRMETNLLSVNEVFKGMTLPKRAERLSAIHDLFTKIYGIDHPRTLYVARVLVNAYNDAGNKVAALKILDDMRSMLSVRLDKLDSYAINFVLDYLSYYYGKLGKKSTQEECLIDLYGLKLDKSSKQYDRLLRSLIYFYKGKEDYNKALTYASERLAIHENTSEDTDNSIIEALSDIVSVHLDLFNYQEAIEFSQRKLAALIKKCGEVSYQVVKTKISISRLYLYSDVDDKAFELCFDAVSDYSKIKTVPDEELFESFSSLINTAFSTNNVDKIKFVDIKINLFYEEILEILKSGIPNSIEIETIYAFLKCLKLLKQYDKAIHILQATKESLAQDEHIVKCPNTLEAQTEIYQDLISIYKKIGDTQFIPKEIEEYFKALNDYIKTNDLVRIPLSTIATDTQSYNRAEQELILGHVKYLEKEIEHRFGNTHRNTVDITLRVASLESMVNNDASAINILEEYLNRDEVKQINSSPRIIELKMQLARFYKAVGSTEKALTIYDEVVNADSKALDDTEGDAEYIYNNIYSAYTESNNHLKSLKVSEKLLSICIRKYGKQSENTIRAMNKVIESYEALDDLYSAISFAKERYEICVQSGSRNISVALSDLIELLVKNKNLKEAVKYKEIRYEKVTTSESAETSSVLFYLADLYKDYARLAAGNNIDDYNRVIEYHKELYSLIRPDDMASKLKCINYIMFYCNKAEDLDTPLEYAKFYRNFSGNELSTISFTVFEWHDALVTRMCNADMDTKAKEFAESLYNTHRDKLSEDNAHTLFYKILIETTTDKNDAERAINSVNDSREKLKNSTDSWASNTEYIDDVLSFLKS